MAEPSDSQRQAYRRFFPQTTRWRDNDTYGHINNVVYYGFFDTAANCYLIEECGLNMQTSEQIGFVVASSCDYLAPIAYPEKIDVGLRVNKLGNSSVEYGLAVFANGSSEAAAIGRFTHVFVDRTTGKPVPMSASIRAGLEKITLPA